MRKIVLLLFLANVVACGLYFASRRTPVRLTAADVSQRVSAGQMTAAERKWEEVAWCDDLCNAFALARQSQRPVLLFYSEGTFGRC